MKRRTDTLDAEFKRRGLMRPTGFARSKEDTRRQRVGPMSAYYARNLGADVVEFDWKGTTVWGVRA